MGGFGGRVRRAAAAALEKMWSSHIPPPHLSLYFSRPSLCEELERRL